jgi:O-methyltransferase
MEIGVFQGGASKFIAHLMREQGDGVLYVCDTFCGHADVDDSIDGGHRVNEGFSDVQVEDVKNYLKEYGNVKFLVGDIVKTSQSIQEKEINLIHLDMDVYPPTKYALEYFWPKVAVGGIIVGDDYGTLSCKGMKKAVNDFVSQTKNCFSMHLITGQIVLVKVGG